jgi:hypothetical protein
MLGFFNEARSCLTLYLMMRDFVQKIIPKLGKVVLKSDETISTLHDREFMEMGNRYKESMEAHRAVSTDATALATPE